MSGSLGFKLKNSSELGAGGYGKVVRAVDAQNRDCAAKIISTGRMKMSAIEKEVGLMKTLVHKYIIGLLGAEQIGKNYIIYMELADRGELFSRVIKAGTLTEPQALRYFKQLMGAVQYMHTQGVVHRDLKLENILLDAADECKVCDFGLAHVYQRDPKTQEPVVTKLREVCGSKSYCAPEVLEGRGYEGPPADVWSCGICLFAMLAGFFPLDEASGSDWRFERVKMCIKQQASVTHTIFGFHDPMHVHVCILSCVWHVHRMYTQATHTIFGFYDRPCPLSRGVCDVIDGMMYVAPAANRLTVDLVLLTPWVQGQMVPGDEDMREAAVCRSADVNMHRMHV